MRLILGVDGGQSSTAALLATTDGRVLGVGAGGPANHIHEPGGVQRMANSLRDAVMSAFASALIPPQKLDSVCFGMTGGMELVPELARAFLATDALLVYHDTVTALAGASLGQPGILVIAGTGAIAYGRTADGREARADGVGYLMGDEGSGYWVGVQALRAYSRAVDGRGPRTVLEEAVPRVLGQSSFADTHRVIYSQQVARPEIASLATVVGTAAAGGDAAAQDILRRAGGHLAEAALAVIHRLRVEHPVIYTTGGVFHSGAWLLDPFREALLAEAPRAEIREPAYPQVVGALILARQQVGLPIPDPFFRSLDQSLPEQVFRKSGRRPGK